jgi:Ca-activated chloride channel family protein
VRVSSKDAALDPASTTPARLPDLHPGVPLVVMGRYVGNSPREFLVEATAAAGEKWSSRVPAHQASSRAIGALWARGHIRDLEDRYACGGDIASLEKQIVETSLRHQVLSRLTAFVAVDRAATVGGDTTLHQIVQPAEIPQGWELDSFPVREEKLRACCLGGSAYFAAEMPAAVDDDAIDRFLLAPAPLLQARFDLSPRGRLGGMPPEPQIDLTEYRQRVAQWLAEMDLLSTSDIAGCRKFLADLLRKLTLLAKELATAGPSSLRVPLVALIAELEAAGKLLSPEQIQEIWPRTQEALRSFVDPAAPAPFWKKRIVT